MTHSPADIVAAHQYLYYALGAPIWTDMAYDAYCRHHGIPGGGGSDCVADYAEPVRQLAFAMRDRRIVAAPTADQITEWLKLPDPTGDGCI